MSHPLPTAINQLPGTAAAAGAVGCQSLPAEGLFFSKGDSAEQDAGGRGSRNTRNNFCQRILKVIENF